HAEHILSSIPPFISKATALTCKIGEQCCPEKQSLMLTQPNNFMVLCLDAGPADKALISSRCSAVHNLLDFYSKQNPDELLSLLDKLREMEAIVKKSKSAIEKWMSKYCSTDEIIKEACYAFVNKKKTTEVDDSALRS
ncbi:unnamed protein product, partial [Didymodactylos carnosus]